MKKVLMILAISFVIFNSSIVIAEAQLQGQAKIDSLLKKLLTSKDDTNKVNIYLDLANLYFDTDLQLYLRYSDSCLILSNKLNWNPGRGKFYINKALYYDNKGQFDKAIHDLLKALDIYTNLGYEDNQAKIFTYLGNLKEITGEYAASLDFHLKSLRLNTKLKREIGRSINLANIGLVYWALGYDTLALEHFQKAIAIDKKMKRKIGLSANYGNMGMVYQKWNNDNLAQKNYQNALNICYEIDDEFGQALNHRNIAMIYSNYGNLDSAYKHLNNSYNLDLKLNNRIGLAETISRYAILEYAITIDSLRTKFEGNKKYYKNNKYHYIKALTYIDSTLSIFDEFNSKSNSIILYKLKSKIQSEMKNYKASLDSYMNYNSLKDSIFSLENTSKVRSLELKYNNDLKNQEIKNLNNKRKEQVTYLIIGIILLFVAFLTTFIRFREKKKLIQALEFQKSIVEEKNEQIYASITYASTIQSAILPWQSTLKNAFSDILIYYKPKDIVSGDSYWFQEVDGIKYLAVIDCTGHGIPGAMLTVIASTALDDAVLGKRLSDTSHILTYMNEKVTEVLNQRLSENSIRDGMEIALIAIHQDKVQFSGAGRPLYMKNGTMEIIKTDKRGIAGQTDNDEYQFSSIEIEKSENLTLYLTSDGYADQMNEHSKKYSTKRFVALLDSISEKPISEQQEILENEFNSHKGGRSQIDDVTILGVRV